jgi:hypothetical protein
MNEETGLQMDEISLSRSGAQDEYADAAADLEWGFCYVFARVGWGCLQKARCCGATEMVAPLASSHQTLNSPELPTPNN